jgi:RNA polymerase sigma-70 factor (ECF subfamily)
MASRSARSVSDLSPQHVGRSISAGYDQAERFASIASYEAELLALARLLVRQEADARDLVQDTIETGMRHADELRDPARLRAWLVSIEVRAAMRFRRRLRHFLPLDFARNSTQADMGFELAGLRMALGRLPIRMRATVILHHVVGLSISETAEALAVSENTTKFQLKEGLRRLREVLR